HAMTMQHFTILGGPRQNLTHERIQVVYLGQVDRPFASQDIRANRFEIVLRDFRAADAEKSRIALAEVAASGVPNYFDDQRFGSVREGEPFLAKALVEGRFEDALKLALTAPYEFDKPADKKEKALIRQFWGDWPRLKVELPRGHARSLTTYLVDHPTDFKGAVTRLRPELRGLYLSAYQSHLWNRILARWLVAQVPRADLTYVRLKLGLAPMPRRATPEQLADWRTRELPLPSARTKIADDDPIKPFVDGVLTEEGLTQKGMQVRGIREMFFSKGGRPAFLVASNVTGEVADDETRPGKKKLTMGFDLPRGCYATLVVKRITG
ncbi:MAG TPA: tRNA pseudouridine(13) synthase TruD, partial [Gemmataceae bacterium]|nr:tRNA pseudouridine(13) synthase TruD [Gemmataceae bacterium]